MSVIHERAVEAEINALGRDCEKAAGARITGTASGVANPFGNAGSGFRANSGQIETFLVMRGLDPRIHADWPQIDGAAWIAGSGPAKTAKRRVSIQSDHALV